MGSESQSSARRDFDPEYMRSQIPILKERLERLGEHSLDRASICSDLVRCILGTEGDVREAHEYAVACDSAKTGWNSGGWFWYGWYFDRNLRDGIQVVQNCSTFEEALLAYSKIEGSFGRFHLAEFFDNLGNVKYAAKHYLEALRMDADEKYVLKAKERLSVLLRR